MSLMRFDPLAGFERLAQQMMGERQGPRPIPMAAFRRGDQVLAYFDLPGVNPEDVDITVERNVVTIRAQRRPAHQEGDEVIVDERPYGIFTRQVFLGDSLDLDNMTADYARGELCLTIPVSEKAKPRRIELRASDQESQQVTASATEGGTR
ncbi:Hsp20/alpha crystallin family protein (plasmid) [Pseudonocardia bannensis]|uniref:Hsp20/alpha crystallin family protein n=1 Tax=Pseudonocardia bannensis TaxID=630973 RepID=A0A848DI60_9PSEU|nr:Hsp20/alpha crystallin family protein [Pseudonocardia bannensis]NMH92372.1 Hsp20/alpha crystallin family protein [Pseudonocardia bannensis]